MMTFIGIDAGGSRTRMLVSTDPDGIPQAFDGAAANVQVVGSTRSAHIIAALVRRGAVEGPVCITAGLAGAGRPSDRNDVAQDLAAILPRASRIRVVSDAELALEAAHGTDRAGFVLIAGTGSIVLGRDLGGAVYRAGGWGYLLGDEGGGYRIGLHGLRAVADALDGGPQTRLTSAAAEGWNIHSSDDLVAAVYQDKRSPAAFAPHVIDAAEEHDEVAHAIVGRHADALARRLSWVVASHPTIPHEIALIGGLTDRAVFRETLTRAVHARLQNANLSAPERSPVEAALLSAFRLP